MSTSMHALRNVFPAILAAAGLIMMMGCADTTTREDLAEASRKCRKNVRM